MLVPTLRLLSHLGVMYIKALVISWHKRFYTFVEEGRRQAYWRNIANNAVGREQNRPCVLACNYSAFRKTQVFHFFILNTTQIVVKEIFLFFIYPSPNL